MKSRTWSLEDAEKKAQVAEDLLNLLGNFSKKSEILDYVQIAESQT